MGVKFSELPVDAAPTNDDKIASLDITTGVLKATTINKAVGCSTTAANQAHVESSTTASAAYAEGDYLVLNDQLYKVTAAIASGQSLVIGTNIASTTTGAELATLNSSLTAFMEDYGLETKCIVKGLLTYSGTAMSSGSNYYGIDDDGTIVTGSTTSPATAQSAIESLSFIRSCAIAGSNNRHLTITVDKNGYYLVGAYGDNITYYSAGDVIYAGATFDAYYLGVVAYLGMVVPNQ